MTVSDLVVALQWFFLLFFLGLNGGYLMLNVISTTSLWRLLQTRSLDDLPQVFSGLEPPVSILVPAFNEEATIVSSIRSLLQLNYSDYEIIIVNDGSRDRTIEVLLKEFEMQLFPEAIRMQLPCARIRGTYLSSRYPNLRLLDKENGGKADALNAGINCARYPLFCSIDADSILQRDSLRRIVQPFVDDPELVAAGGTIRLANGCRVEGGFLTNTALPASWLARIQIVEYLRAFLFGRLGWSPLNALLIMSGAFSLFRRSHVVEVGGYRTDTIGEDMELVVRLHRVRRRSGKPCRMMFLPDPVCWTEAPEDLPTLRRQRTRWQRGLGQSLMANLGLLFHPRGGAAGWIAFPFMLIFEWLGPLIETAGYLFIIVAYAFGLVSFDAVAVFMFVAIGLGILLSVNALFLEEISFHVYTRKRDTLLLLMAAVVENFGYRQLMTLWRLLGFLAGLRGGRASWGEMKRSATWQRPS